ncbi:NADH-quinone oxidoreductase subunit NuoN [Nocardioides marmoribigeumensis]|uniref:NADH-quinone oxidoreductase subunit N n=1 Tax=Nocardioides marmoribigeumensis TaxID=433649 RepID=A0ABU2BTQ7_9ACTN|nr:NADH-quinone oxidoreductase subunit NuoN [Nocardioides marmoribigeumensis]MDR7361676.1 NADH-quinone oxidoreductase subunit N [Nocardioides marmoribigeumensis]
MNAFDTPKLEYFELSPLLVVFGVALVGVLVEAFAPRERRYLLQTAVTVLGTVGALVMTVLVARDLKEYDGARGAIAAMGAIAVDGPSVFVWGLLLVLSLLSALLFAERQLDGGVTAFAGQAAALPGTEAERQASSQGLEHTEVFPLLMFSVGGMMLFAASNDLVTMFVALEVFSLPLYLLCGLARRRRLLSQEAALKYFMLGAFSSGFFLYGVALVYGYAGATDFAAISQAVSGRVGGEGLLLGGIALLAVGLLFKIGAVPFHSWTPDVYQGAPTAVTGFMAACTKIAAFGALLRLFYVGFGGAREDWTPMIWAVAIATMVVGSLFALVQSDIKRMLAYSSIAHAGFVLVGFVGLYSGGPDSVQISSLQAVLFYLVTYGFMTVGAFGIVTLVRDAGGEANHLSRWAGLGKEAPLVAAVMSFFLLGMAGIPLTSGFTGKWAVFTSAAQGGAVPLVVIAVVLSAVAAFFYLRVIVQMYFADPVGEGPTIAMPSVLTAVVIAVGFAATLLLGIVPGPILDLAGNAGSFIR